MPDTEPKRFTTYADTACDALVAAGEGWERTALDLVSGIDDRRRTITPGEDTRRRETIKGIVDYLEQTGTEPEKILNTVLTLINVTITTNNTSGLLAELGVVLADKGLLEQADALVADDRFIVIYHQEIVVLSIAAGYADKGDRDKAFELVEYSEGVFGETQRYAWWRNHILQVANAKAHTTA